jgi:hypothetical protein
VISFLVAARQAVHSISAGPKMLPAARNARWELPVPKSEYWLSTGIGFWQPERDQHWTNIVSSMSCACAIHFINQFKPVYSVHSQSTNSMAILARESIISWLAGITFGWLTPLLKVCILNPWNGYISFKFLGCTTRWYHRRYYKCCQFRCSGNLRTSHQTYQTKKWEFSPTFSICCHIEE